MRRHLGNLLEQTQKMTQRKGVREFLTQTILDSVAL
jgi:hypothetical protein